MVTLFFAQDFELLSVHIRMPVTRRGRANRDKSARKTAKWVEGGGLERAKAFLNDNTSKQIFFISE
jgi:hypothetical protein